MSKKTKAIIEQNKTHKANYAGNVILHLSDLHFVDEPNQAVKRTNILNDLIDCLNNVPPDWKPNIICITGDISDKAKIEGYKIAKDWIEKLRKGLKIQRKNLVLCPGNHDVDDNKAKSIDRPKNTKEANDTFIEGQIPSIYEDLFLGFIDLCKNNLKLSSPIHGEFSSFLFGIRKINNIYFLVCNSCWFFKNIKEEDREGMWLGYPLFEYLNSKLKLSSLKSSDLVIALIHHPERKLHVEETARYDNTPTFAYIRDECSELILSGDLHGLPLPSSKSHTINCGRLFGGMNNGVFYLIQIKDGRCFYQPYTYDQSRVINRWESEGQPRSILFGESEKIMNAIMDKGNPRETLKILKEPRVFKRKQRKIRFSKIYKKPERTSTIDKQPIIDSIRTQIVKAQRNIEMLEYEKSFIITDGIVNKLKETESLLPEEFLSDIYSDLANLEITRVNWLTQMKGMPKDFSRVKEYYRKAKEHNEKK